MRVSLVIPTFQRPIDLARCLNSIAAQDRPVDEIVVVVRADDNASHGVLDEFEDKLPITRQNPPFAGIVSAAQTGLSAATGDICIVVDDDAELSSVDFVSRYESGFRRDEIVAIGGHNSIPGRINKKTSVPGQLHWWGALSGNFYEDTPRGQFKVQHLQGCNMAFKQPLPRVEMNLRGDGSFYELDLCLQSSRRGDIIFDSEIDVIHHLADRGSEASRSWTNVDAVSDACFNIAFVLSKHTDGQLRRIATQVFLLLVGQRKTWGFLRLIIATTSRELTPKQSEALLRASLTSKLEGWRFGRKVRACHQDP